MEQQKSTGIKNLGSFLTVCSTLGIFAGFLIAMSGGELSFINTFMRGFFILTPLSYLIGSIGLRRLKNWARLLTIINALILSVVYSVVVFSGLHGVEVFPLVFWLIITIPSCLVIYYLTRPQIKEQFKR